MNQEIIKKKRGRPPINAEPLTQIEKMQRYREKLKSKGKHYTIFVSGEYMQYITAMAESNKVTETEVIRNMVDVSLRRFISIKYAGYQMLTDGYTSEQVAKYMHDNTDPELTDCKNYRESSQ